MNAQDHFMSEQHQNALIKFVCQRIVPPINNTDDQQTISTNQSSDTSHQQLNETMDILIGGVQALNDDTQRLSSDSLLYQNIIQSLSEQLSKVKAAIQETHPLIDAHNSNQQILEQSIVSLKQQIDDQKNVSYDGTLLWKITN
jgi:peptidoglycan hydrolase CwlO-like protein